MKKLLTLLLMVSALTFAQTINHDYFVKNNEVYFKFSLFDKSHLQEFSKIISIDNFKNDFVYAYANESEFNAFLKTGTKYQVLPHPGDVEVAMSNNLKDIKAWDVYPTYDAYVAMMNQFATSFPTMCRIVDLGTTAGGRKILFAVLSKNVNVREAEPQLQYSSTIHGDETTGYVLMLRLIDYMLNNYNIDPKVTNLLDHAEIWINPDANPDGTYYGGNSTVTGSRRYNLAGVDINRNFPDIVGGAHPDGNAYQGETLKFKALFDANNFVLSANFHGGAEVVNYPWDGRPALHPDDAWWRQIARSFADTVHVRCSNNGYMTDLDNGITNGYAWYLVYGGRQDYITYYDRGREMTIEIGATKTLPAAQLPTYWNYLYPSFLNLLGEGLKGISGVVTDSLGNKVKANIKVVGRDALNSDVYSDSLTGKYYRPINPGTYTLQVTAGSFVSKTITGVVVPATGLTLNIQLSQFPTPVELTSLTAVKVGKNVELAWSTATETNNSGFDIEKIINGTTTKIGFVAGHGTTTNKNNYTFTDLNAGSGLVQYRLKQIDLDGTINYTHSVEVNLDNVYGFELSQNYPNPFNPSTKIEFNLPASQYVSLSVFNTLGEKVTDLVNEELAAGKHSITFDASKLTSGMYIYRLTSGTNSISKQMMLVK